MNKYFCFLILFSFLFSGCQKEEILPDEPVRTLLVYLARDSDLSVTAEEKAASILKGWDGKGGHLIIYEDVTGKLPSLQEVIHKNGENYLQVVETYEEENSASTEVFNRVIRDVKKNYPADSYGMIFFSHASGWLPDGTLVTPRSIAMDGDKTMELSGFAAAIPDHTFDFIVMEACFMAGVEVAYELRNKTTLLLVSAAEVLSPGFRDTYASHINLLFKEKPDVTGFAQKAFESVDAKNGSFRSGTLSVINTSTLETLATWLKTRITIPEPLEGIPAYQIFDRYYGLFFDFEEFYSSLLNETERKEFSSLLNKLVLYRGATPEFMMGYSGFIIKNHSGMTSYIPQQRYPYLNEEYKKLGWYKALFE